MKTLVVVNPYSANGATGRQWPTIRQALKQAMHPVEEQLTRGPGHATELVQEELAKGCQRVIAVGGDGTNNEVVNGFFDRTKPINTKAVLGLIPSGTGGDLRKTLGIGRKLAQCIPVLAASKTKPVDVGWVKYLDHQGKQVERLFINITSFGIAGMVDAKVNQSSKALGGKLSFVLGTLRALATYRNKPVHLRVRSHDKTWLLDKTLPINNVAVANGQYFGGGMWVAPHALIDDGLFDVIVIGDLTRTSTILKAPRIYKGTHLKLPEVQSVRGTYLEASCQEEVLIDMDGEQPGRLPICLDILPRAIRLIVP